MGAAAFAHAAAIQGCLGCQVASGASVSNMVNNGTAITPRHVLLIDPPALLLFSVAHAAVVVSFFFLVSLFFSPILASIPPYASALATGLGCHSAIAAICWFGTPRHPFELCALLLDPNHAAGPALVLVGTILLGHIAHIEWDDIGIAIPAFLTMVLMPFTYSGKCQSQMAERSDRLALAPRFAMPRQPLTRGPRCCVRLPCPALPCPAVAYGVIAGLVSYLAIHLPFWVADTLRRRWWPPTDGDNSPRSERRRANKTGGYNHRKHFGPPPSRTESFAGYGSEASVHTQDTRRSTLPIAFMGGGGAAMGANGSTPRGGRSNAPSVMYFQEGSLRGGTAAGARLAVRASPALLPGCAGHSAQALPSLCAK